MTGFSLWKRNKGHRAALVLTSAAVLLTLCTTSVFAEATQSGEQKNVIRVGHSNLQGRKAYQPSTILYPDGRTIAFIGTHAGAEPNPLNGGVVEANGTMIVDVSDPDKAKDLFHIPGTGGDSQMTRLCLGADLPGGVAGKVYLMRNFKTGYETWDVTKPRQPKLLQTYGGFPVTHKMWWECSTGIAYMPGSLTVDGWRQKQSMVIVNWSNPAKPPVYIRTFGLPGAQPTATGPIPPSLHGAISAHDHPMAAKPVGDGSLSSDVVGNRVYAAYGVGDDGVVQVLNRAKLLYFMGDAHRPVREDLLAPQIGKLIMSPDQGGHTSMPVFGVKVPSFQDFSELSTRDLLIVTSESTANQCQEAPHWGFITDITTESKPFNLSTMSVDPRDGEKFDRGNYCTRGSRFGAHSSEENWNNPYYGKLTFIAYFSGGTRVWDIRNPTAPVEVGFYVPVNNKNTQESCATINGKQVCKKSYMTNNLELDDRGYIYSVDRAGTGMDILELTGKAKRIGEDRL